MRSILLLALILVPLHLPAAVKGEAHANTKPLKLEGDLSVQMVAGIDRFLMRETMEAAKRRPTFWKRDYRANDTYHFSVLKNRDHFRYCIGAVDELETIKGLEYISTTTRSSLRYQDSTMTIHAVRWAVLHGVHGEGLLIQPQGAIRARVVAIPYADQTPEQLAGIAPGIEPKAQFARRLAAAGCQVVVPTLISRSDEHSGNARVRFTNQPHREWVYRQAFQMGRHIIGYEVLKVQAIINWFAAENSKIPDPPAIGIAGYHEGGLIAFYAAALDQRIQATLVSGYFSERNRVWEEPIYRNVFGLLEQFGDAEIASLISPRSLVIEHSEIPEIKGPPKPRKGRSGGAAPGILKTPRFTSVNAEYKRAMKLAAKNTQMALVTADDDQALDTFGSDPAIETLLRMLQVSPIEGWKSSPPPAKKLQLEVLPERQQRQVAELVEYNQRLLRFSEYDRTDNFWRKLPTNDVNNWTEQCDPHRRHLWQNVIGQFPAANLPANPRSRKILETEKWTCYEVVLDVWRDVFAWGYLLVPKDIRPG